MSTDKEQVILRALYEQNPWWVKEAVPEELVYPLKKPFRRRDFFVLRDKLHEKEISAIIGPRQVGKTTTIYQLIDYLLNPDGIDAMFNIKVDPKRIIYFSFDYPRLVTEISINDVLDIYFTDVLREEPQKLKARVYFFLDEVCRIENWSELLKGWQDLKYDIKFVVSHSSSSKVYKGASESLIGRIAPFIMFPLKFVDIVRFYNEETCEKINDLCLSTRNAFSQAINSGDIKIFFEKLKCMRSDLVPHEQAIKALLQEYLLKDGYPGLLGVKSLRVCSEKLRTYLHLTLYKDIVQVFGVRNPKALDDLVVSLASESSSLVDISSLSKTLSIRFDTLKKYLDHLEDVFLISRSEFYSGSRSKRIRKQDKIYLTNVGLRNVLLETMDESLLNNPTALGTVVETLVYDHCKRLRFCLAGPPANLFYWRNSQKHEVDIVMEVFQKTIPIEVTYRGDIPAKKLRVIDEFTKKYRSPLSIMVTKDNLDFKGKTVYIPLWLFLLIC
jgi:predicted AAA+ superfamily ATPase